MAGVLALGNVGLFVYDNVILKNQEANQKSVIYAARDDIQQNQTITPDLFNEIEISNSGLLPTYVTDIKKVEGYKVAGGLKKYDVLTTMRVSKEEIEEGDYYLEIRPDEPVDLYANDSVTVYFRENKTGNVYVLFKNRLVLDAVDKSASTTQNSSQNYKILGSEEDAALYFKYKLLGDILLVKHTETYDGETDETTKDYEVKKLEAERDIK